MENVLFTIAMPISRVPSMIVETDELNSRSTVPVPSMLLCTVAAACFESQLELDAKYSHLSREIPEKWRWLSTIRTIDASSAELTLWSRSGFEGGVANRKTLGMN